MVHHGKKISSPMKGGAMIWLQNFYACSFWIDSATLCQIRSFTGFSLSIYELLTCFPQVVAPVRETVSQTLGSLLLHMPHRSLVHVHAILLQMIQQDFPVPLQGKKSKSNDGKNHIWEIRHAGLLGIKYEVAVRSDLFDQPVVKREEESGDAVLRGVVDAAILGCVGRKSHLSRIASNHLITALGIVMMMCGQWQPLACCQWQAIL